MCCGPQQRRQHFHYPFTTICSPRQPLVIGLPARNCSEIDCCCRRTSRTAAGPRATSHKLPKAVSQVSWKDLEPGQWKERREGKKRVLTKPSEKPVRVLVVLQARLVEEEARRAISGVDGDEVPF